VRAPAGLVVAVLVLAACAADPAGDDRASAGSASSVPGSGAGAVTVEHVPAGPVEDVVSALDDPAAEGLPAPLVDPSHFTGQAIAGVLTGTELDSYPVATVSWADWRNAHPDGLVLSRDTGHERDYGRNPYPGYDDVDNPPFLFGGTIDGRLAANTRVVGTGLDATPIAIRLDALLDAGVVPFDVDGEPVGAWALPGTASALDAGEIADGRGVGATGVFRTTHDDQVLTFSRHDDGFLDDQTGSRRNIFGTAVDGPLEGTTLTPVGHLDTFWFAWAAFAPDTTVVS
jgi:hypothetical protein